MSAGEVVRDRILSRFVQNARTLRNLSRQPTLPSDPWRTGRACSITAARMVFDAGRMGFLPGGLSAPPRQA